MKRRFLSYGISLGYDGESFGCASHCRRRKIGQTFCFLWGVFGVSCRFCTWEYTSVIQYYFSEEICQSSPPFLWSQRWENYRGCKYSEGSKDPGRAGDVSANAAGFWFLLWFLPVIPEVTGKRKLFYPWQGASRAVQPFLLLLVEKSMSGEWGKAEVKTQDTAIRSYSSTSLFYKEPYQHSTS